MLDIEKVKIIVFDIKKDIRYNYFNSWDKKRSGNSSSLLLI